MDTFSKIFLLPTELLNRLLLLDVPPKAVELTAGGSSSSLLLNDTGSVNIRLLSFPLLPSPQGLSPELGPNTLLPSSLLLKMLLRLSLSFLSPGTVDTSEVLLKIFPGELPNKLFTSLELLLVFDPKTLLADTFTPVSSLPVEVPKMLVAGLLVEEAFTGPPNKFEPLVGALNISTLPVDSWLFVAPKMPLSPNKLPIPDGPCFSVVSGALLPGPRPTPSSSSSSFTSLSSSSHAASSVYCLFGSRSYRWQTFLKRMASFPACFSKRAETSSNFFGFLLR